MEVGEYIRTKTGEIGKIININVREGLAPQIYLDIYTENDITNYFVYDFDIVKHSKNIIDLIEEGDYVNDCEIEYIHENKKGETLLENENVKFTEKDIKSIVTKEQFNSIKYEVE